MVSLQFPIGDGGGVCEALASGGFPRAGGLRLDLGLLSSLPVANTVRAPVRAVGAEHQEGGENGQG